MTNPTAQLEMLRERIQSSPNISEADREVLHDYDDALSLLNAEYSAQRHLKLLQQVTIIAEEVGGLADALEDRSVAGDIVRWVHETYDHEETNQSYRVALRVFGKHVTDGDDLPASLEWIYSGTSSNYDPAPEPADMLDWHDDVLPMIDSTRNSRDAAAIALQFDAGLLGGKFQDLTVGDITDHKHGLQVSVEGKQGKRTVTLIPSVPHVQRWLTDHPAPHDGDAPLWSKLATADGISYHMLTKMFS